MIEGENGWRFDNNRKFRVFDHNHSLTWTFESKEQYNCYHPNLMRFVTPFNMMYVLWTEFEAIINEVLEMWRGDKEKWKEYAAEAYLRMKTRGDALQKGFMRSRMYLWKKYKGDKKVVWGMARTKTQRDAIEKYKTPPYD